MKIILLLLSLSFTLGLANTFSVTGLCTASGNCFQSPNYSPYRYGQDQYDPDKKYGQDQACDITATTSGKIYAVKFDTEPDYDFLTIGGTKYSGYSSNAQHVVPYGVSVTQETVISWVTHYDSYTKTGFEICMYPDCTVGVNTVDCGCGTDLCVADTGLHCSADGECSAGPSCQEGKNTEDCKCGTVACNSFNGRYCTPSQNLCTKTELPSFCIVDGINKAFADKCAEGARDARETSCPTCETCPTTPDELRRAYQALGECT